LQNGIRNLTKDRNLIRSLTIRCCYKKWFAWCHVII